MPVRSLRDDDGGDVVDGDEFGLQVLELLLQRLGRRARDEQLALVAADLAADLFLLGREVVVLVLEELGRQRGLGAGRRPGVRRFGGGAEAAGAALRFLRRARRRAAADAPFVDAVRLARLDARRLPFVDLVLGRGLGARRRPFVGRAQRWPRPLRGVSRKLAAAARITHRKRSLHAARGQARAVAPGAPSQIGRRRPVESQCNRRAPERRPARRQRLVTGVVEDYRFAAPGDRSGPSRPQARSPARGRGRPRRLRLYSWAFPLPLRADVDPGSGLPRRAASFQESTRRFDASLRDRALDPSGSERTGSGHAGTLQGPSSPPAAARCTGSRTGVGASWPT